jgi:hypothetical protein
MLATLQVVDPSTRSWDTQYGKKAAFMVTFTDGRTAQVNTNWEIVAQKVEAWTNMIGQERDFEFTEQAPWPSGDPKPPKVKLAEQSGPGGSQGRLPVRSTKDDEAISRAVALKAAVHVATDADDAIFIAELFDKWLRKEVGGGVHGEGAPSPATSSTPVVTPTGEKPGMGDPGPAHDDGGGHLHDYKRIPNVTKFVRCDCGATEKKHG